MENYKFTINALRSGTFMGTLSFVAPDGNYAWFRVEVRAMHRGRGRWSQTTHIEQHPACHTK